MRSKKLAIFALCLGVVLLLGFAACGGDKGGGGASGSVSESNSSESGGAEIESSESSASTGSEEVQGETLADGAAWAAAINNTLSKTNATVSYTMTMDERTGEYFMTTTGSATAKVADRKIHQSATGRESCYYPSEDGTFIEEDDDFSSEMYIAMVDGVAMEWSRYNTETWDCYPYEGYEGGFTPTVGGLLRSTIGVYLDDFADMYAAFENVDGTYVLEMTENGASGRAELKFVNGLLYSYVMNSVYTQNVDGQVLTETTEISMTLSYDVANVGELPPMTWEGGEGGVGGDDKPSKPDDSESEECPHAFSEYISNGDATCEEDGTKTAWCDYGCGEADTVTDEGSATGCSFTEYKSNGDATCQEDGTKTATCDNGCGETDTVTDEGSKLEHSYVDGVCDGCGQEEYSQGVQFVLNADGESYSVAKYEGTDTRVLIPSKYKDKPVVAIAKRAFSNNKTMTEIVIPDSIQTLGEYAFEYCEGLTEIILPEGIENLELGVFFSCESLAKITIPISLKTIAADTFQYCNKSTEIYITDIKAWCGISGLGQLMGNATDGVKLYLNGSLITDLEIPDGVTQIADRAFFACTSLTSISIPDSVTHFGDYVFYDCVNLQYELQDGLKYLGNKNNPYIYLLGAESTGITRASVHEDCKFIGSGAFESCTLLTNVQMPDGVLSICSSAFYGCASLEEITIPTNVTRLGSYAFYGCSTLEMIEIPDGITFVAYSLFEGCSGLTTVKLPSTITEIESDAFEGCTNLTELKIPDGVTAIGSAAFRDCSSLNTEIPDSVTSMGSGVFYGCKKIKKVKILDGTKYINSKEFYNCRSLMEVTIPDGVEIIGSSAFENCVSLQNLVIPNSVTKIGETAFANCSGLTELIIPFNVKEIGLSAFVNWNSELTVYCERETRALFWDSAWDHGVHAVYWYSESEPALNSDETAYDGNYWHYGENGEVVVWVYGEIEEKEHNYVDGVCTSCGALKPSEGLKYELNSDEKSYAVAGIGSCKDTEIVIPDEYEGLPVTRIRSSAFNSNSNLVKVVVPDSVTSIGKQAFWCCDYLTEVTIGENSQLTSIGENAFGRCYSLRDITLPDSLTEIGYEAFIWCALTKVVIPHRVTIIGARSFVACEYLTEVVIPSNVTTIDYEAFQLCKQLERITFEEDSQLTTIVSGAFSNCSSLTEIVLPESVTVIWDSVFSDSTNLTSIKFKGTVAQWNAVTKEAYWNKNVPATKVVCSDGEVAL